MDDSAVDGALLIFTKPPIAGQVKTRLIPAIGPERALEVYQELLSMTLNTAVQAGFASTQLWVSDSPEHEYIEHIKDLYAIEVFPQKGEDLGQRMFNALDSALREYSYAVLIGCDCPSLGVSDLSSARNHLINKIDIVLGPATDGGYYLIGATKNDDRVFSGISWGKENVFKDTCENIEKLDWKFETLPTRWDVDRPEDLAHYFNMKTT